MLSKNESRQNMVLWNVLRHVYKLLATEEAQAILQILLKEESIRSTPLREKTKLTESQFHPIMRELVNCVVVEKEVGSDRGVSYKISPFGKHVLELSEPLLTKVKQEVGPLLLKK